MAALLLQYTAVAVAVLIKWFCLMGTARAFNAQALPAWRWLLESLETNAEVVWFHLIDDPNYRFPIVHLLIINSRV